MRQYWKALGAAIGSFVAGLIVVALAQQDIDLGLAAQEEIATAIGLLVVTLGGTIGAYFAKRNDYDL